MAHSMGSSTSADRATGSTVHSGRVIGMSGGFSPEHWIVPVRGLSPSNPKGTVEALAHRDGTVSLSPTCGHSQITVRFDACRAAQSCPPGSGRPSRAAQQLITSRQPRPPFEGSQDLPQAWRVSPSTSPPDGWRRGNDSASADGGNDSES